MKKFVLILSIILLLIAGADSIYKRYVFNRDVVSYYEAAEEDIAREDYDSAYDKLWDIYFKDYKDTQALCDLCNIYKAYNNKQFGEVNPAGCSTDFQYQSDEFVEEYKSFLMDMQKRYDDYWARRDAREEELYQEKVANGVPFEGMRKEDVSKTILGEPDAVYNSSELVGGERKDTVVYQFEEGDYIIYKAVCMNSWVEYVVDYRDKPLKKYVGSSSSNKSPKEEKYDEFGVYDYYDAEDFYYDNYDDFWDYEDAEDYFNEAWDNY